MKKWILILILAMLCVAPSFKFSQKSNTGIYWTDKHWGFVYSGNEIFGCARAMSGEKEELDLKELALQERIGRLRAEFELATRDMATIQQAKKALSEKEKQEPAKK